MRGKVFLVGAGPGAPGLITVRALEVLKEADVVFYDRLVHPYILEYAEKASLIYCGKEPGRHVWNQERINEGLISEALKGKTVVRLKGGDPFIFGRGGEEAFALQKKGIPFEVIPGVTSAIGIPGMSGIPLTHRGISSTLAIVTGRQDPTCPSMPVDWDAVSRIESIVVLMGVKELPKIVDRLTRIKPLGTPVAVISHGTLHNQKIIRGSLADIVEKCKRSKVKPPAVIVIGKVVKFIEKFSMLQTFPLLGVKVELVGSSEDIRPWLEYFYNSGALVRKIAYQKTFSPEFLRILENVQDSRLLVFYDVEAVEGFFSGLHEKEIDIRELRKAKFGVASEQLASELKKHGIFSGIEVIGERIPENSLIFVSSPVKEIDRAVCMFDTQILMKCSKIDSDASHTNYTVLLSPSGIRFIKKSSYPGFLAVSMCRPLLELQGIHASHYFESFREITNFIRHFLNVETKKKVFKA